MNDQTTNSIALNVSPLPEDSPGARCCHHTRKGRCRMLRAPDHQSLCAHHLRKTATTPPDDEALAAELLASTGQLSSAGEVNTFLGNLVRQLARNASQDDDLLGSSLAIVIICCRMTAHKGAHALPETVPLHEVFHEHPAKSL